MEEVKEFSLLDLINQGGEETAGIDAGEAQEIFIQNPLEAGGENPQNTPIKPEQKKEGEKPPTETPEKPGENGSENPDEDAKISATTTAKGFVFLYDFAMPRICGAIAKERDIEQFKLQASEKKELTEAAINYFKTVDFGMSPGAVLLLTVVILSAGNIALAMEIKGEKEDNNRKAKNFSREERKPVAETEKKEAAKVIKMVNRESSQSIEANSHKFDYGDRKRFEVDKNGYYIYSAGAGKSKYLAKSERGEVATKEVVEWKKRGLSNREILNLIK